ncbi:MAG: hypothetical protein ABR549_02105 [Mycobacteriales bacterium]
MSRHLLLVASEPMAGQEAEFNTWYDDVHLPDVLQVPGFVRAERLIAAPSVHGELPEHRYLAIYEIETDDLPRALAALREAARGMYLSPAFDRAATTQFAYTALEPSSGCP